MPIAQKDMEIFRRSAAVLRLAAGFNDRAHLGGADSDGFRSQVASAINRLYVARGEEPPFDPYRPPSVHELKVWVRDNLAA